MKMRAIAVLVVSLLVFNVHAGGDAGNPDVVVCATGKDGRCIAPFFGDGGTRLTEIYQACPSAPLVQRTADGGYFLTEARHDRIACMMTGCETYARRLESNAREHKAEDEEISIQAILIGGGVIFAAGMAAGVYAHQRVTKP